MTSSIKRNLKHIPLADIAKKVKHHNCIGVFHYSETIESYMRVSKAGIVRALEDANNSKEALTHKPIEVKPVTGKLYQIYMA